MIDLSLLWDFDDPAASEARFRAAALAAVDAAERDALLTQAARALGLRERYDEAHALLDSLTSDEEEVVIRALLERGRLFRSSGQPERGRPLFEGAAAAAAGAGLDLLQVDALHMLALVAEPGDQLALNHRALAVALASSDRSARDWDASLLNNIGMTHADARDYGAALESFEAALAASERIGDDARTRVAKWMVAWTLRLLGRTDEALAAQRALKAELVRAGVEDPFVDEELALLEG